MRRTVRYILATSNPMGDLEALEKLSTGTATKIIIPSEIQGIAGLVKSIAEVAGTEKAETPEK